MMLRPDGLCSIYSHRPFMCRNAFAHKVCTVESHDIFGFGNLVILAYHMRHEVHTHFRLDRFDRPGIRTASVSFFLPEGLLWLRDHPALDRLRSLFLDGQEPTSRSVQGPEAQPGDQIIEP